MKISTRSHEMLIVAAALLAGCGGSQPPIGAPGAMLPRYSKAQDVRPVSMQAALGSAERLRNLARRAAERGNPVAPLIDVGGKLYGTTEHGGAFSGRKTCRGGCGTVFSITTSGTEKVLHSFGNSQDGQYPEAALVNVGGTLYGTTSAGGTYGDGTVFSVTTDGVETVLHSFGGQPDGSDPTAGLIGVKGTLYGTTSKGGAYCSRTTFGGQGYGCGTVFSITTSGVEKVLHSFGNGHDGQYPEAALVNAGGTLYGTTIFGGTVRHPLGHGDSGGTVFSITTSGVEKVLYSLGHRHGGIWPLAPLLPVNGAFYGTTSQGGAHNAGTVFVVTTDGKATILHNFSNLYRYDGSNPAAGLIDLKGTLYGTTYFGGACDVGTVFSLTTSGVETVLHSFFAGLICQGKIDGAFPTASLIHVNGELYGTTEYGGGFPKRCPNGGSSVTGCGTVFSITTAGQVKLLHRFH